MTGEAQSCFLPGTKVQFAWDSTSLGMLKTCPRLYQYQMIEGWTTRAESIHLRWGIEYHAALQDFDLLRAEGTGFDDAVRETISRLLDRIHTWQPDPDLDKRSEALKSKSALVQTVIWYLDHFRDDAAETVILDNGKPAVELSFRFELDWGPSQGQYLTVSQIREREGIFNISVNQPYLLCGHLDRVVNFQGAMFVMDRKTTTTTPSAYYFAQYEPNNQMTLYTLASRVILGTPIRGVIIDVAQVLSDSSRFVRGFTYRTEDQLSEWMLDLSYWFNLAETFATNGYWPMNDTACDKFGGCRFRSICSKSSQVREQFLRSDFVQQPPEDRWNPLKPR